MHAKLDILKRVTPSILGKELVDDIKTQLEDIEKQTNTKFLNNNPVTFIMDSENLD